MSAYTFWIVVVVCIAVAGCSSSLGDNAPVHRVMSHELEPLIVGHGAMSPAQATAIIAPRARSTKPFVVSWIVSNGARVDEGDPIVRFDLETFQLEHSQRALEVLEAQSALAAKKRELAAQEAALRNGVSLTEEQVELADQLRSGGELANSRLELADAVDDLEFLHEKRKLLAGDVDRLDTQFAAELDVLEQRLKVAQALLARAAEDIRGAELRAPHEGIVTLEQTWNGEPLRAGDAAFAGRKLATLSPVSGLKAVLHVPEVDAVGLALGLPAELALPGLPDKTARGSIVEISEHASRVNAKDPVQYFAVEVELAEPNAELVPGRSVEGRIRPFQPVEVAVAVPLHLVSWKNGAAFVHIFVDGKLYEHPIQLGRIDGALAEVLSGLKAGDMVSPRVGGP